MNTEPIAGADLRRERESLDVKAFEVAALMHVHSSRVSQIEALAIVTVATVERYREALRQVATTPANVQEGV